MLKHFKAIAHFILATIGNCIVTMLILLPVCSFIWALQLWEGQKENRELKIKGFTQEIHKQYLYSNQEKCLCF